MEKIHVSFIKDLRNREFSHLISDVSEISAESKCKNSSFIKATNNLQSHYKKLLQLKDTKPSHHLTEVINKKVRNRTEYLACLRMRIRAALLSPIPEERIAAKRLKFWIDRYKKELFKPSLTVQTQAVGYLHLDKIEDATIQKYTALLNLDELLDIIVSVTDEVKKLIIERGRDIVHRAVNGRKVRKAAYHDLQVLLNVMHTLYYTSDYSQEVEKIAKLSRLMNIYLTSFRRELRSRNTKRKNKKEVDVAVKELISVEGVESDKLPMPSSGQKLDSSGVSTVFFREANKDSNIKLRSDIEDSVSNGEFYNSNGKDNSTLNRGVEKAGDDKLPPV